MPLCLIKYLLAAAFAIEMETLFFHCVKRTRSVTIRTVCIVEVNCHSSFLPFWPQSSETLQPSIDLRYLIRLAEKKWQQNADVARLKNESWIACNALKVNQALLGVWAKQENPLWAKWNKLSWSLPDDVNRLVSEEVFYFQRDSFIISIYSQKCSKMVRGV